MDAGLDTGLEYWAEPFDPVHCGHLEIARRALEEAALDRVIFIPAGSPRLKSSEPTAAPEHRLAMLNLAVAGVSGFEVSDIELGRVGPTKTVETLQRLRGRLDEDVELVFILGLDVLMRVRSVD